MVAAYYDDRIVQLAAFFQNTENDAQSGIESLTFAEIVAEIFPNDSDIGQSCGQFPLQIVGIESPQGPSRSLRPIAVGIRRTPPIAEGFIVGIGIEEIAEIFGYFVVKFLFAFLVIGGTGGGHLLRERIEFVAVPAILVAIASVRRIEYDSGCPCLVGETYEITVFFQQQRITRDRSVPFGAE